MKREYHTKSKDYIMEYIKANKERCFSALDIYAYLQTKDAKINMTTVYRNLDKLLAAKMLIKFNNNKDSFAVFQYHEPEDNCDGHLHIQCSECGKIVHLEEEFMEVLDSYLTDKCGFRLACASSVLIGTCNICSK